jgi:hypothetical protein
MAPPLRWLANTEGDVTGYRIYMSACEQLPVRPAGFRRARRRWRLANGVTRYFAPRSMPPATRAR